MTITSISITARLRAGVAPLILCAAALSTPAYAQETPQAAADESTPEDAIIVTGSRIARPDLAASVPVAVVSQERIQQTGAANIQDVLAELPSVGQNISRSSSNFSTTGNGAATVNLRNLGEERTLVLVNGRRFVAGLPGTSIVDLNTIPTDLIKQVEVVTGGASAVYGSEAIAGVVNFVLDDEFQGLRARAQGTISDEGDAGRQTVSITGGTSFNDNRGHIVINGTYDRDEGLRSRNRAFSARDIPNRSSYSPQGLFSPDGSFGSLDGSTFTFDTDNNLKEYEGANIDGYNRNSDRYLSVPVERYLVTALGKYEFSPAAELYGEFTYAKTKTRARLEAQAVDYADLNFPDGTEYAGIPIDNPFIPDDIRAAMVTAGVTALPFRRRSNDIFDRSNITDRETWRAVVGLRGDLGGSFKYDVYYNHGETKDYTRSGTILAPQYRNALDAVQTPGGPACRINVDADPTNDDAACVPINIFGFNTVSPEAANYVTNGGQLSTYNAKVKQDVFSASITGQLFSLGGSPVSFAAGGEYRRESSVEDFDEATNLGLTLGNLLTDTRGKYNVKEGFLEVVAPIIEDRPGAHYLGVEAAARYADYSTVGGVWSWKIGGEYAPIPDVRFRAVYAEATRAPNISELFSARNETFPAVVDPCDQRGGEGDGSPIVIGADALPAACLAIPAIAAAANGGGFVYSTAQIQTINGFTGGNVDLKQEKAKTFTAGVVVQPRMVRGLSLTVDYYRIEVENAIGIIGQQTSLDECYTGSGDPLFCSNITRNSAGIVTQIDAINLNVGSYLVEGLDIQGRYSTNIGSNAKLDLAVFWNHLLTQEQTSFQGGPVQNEVGQLDCYECGRLGTGFKDKVNASATLTWQDFSLNWRVNYMSSVVDTLGEDSISTGSYTYHDAQLRVKIDEEKRFELYFGIDNVFDTTPPVFGDTNVVTFPGTQTAAKTYDTFGRLFYAGVDVKF